MIKLTGISVNGGKVSGKALVIDKACVDKVENGMILVVEHSSPQYAIHLFNAKGLICQNGAIMAHICIIAGELGIPCITRVDGALQNIKSGDYVTIDGDNNEVIVDDRS